MAITGAMESILIVSLAVFDTFPAASLHQRYTVLIPVPLLKVYDLLRLNESVDVTAIHPVAVGNGTVGLVET